MAKNDAAAAADLNESKDLTNPKNTQLSTAVDFGDDAGAGFEGTTSESFAIPFLGILQKISPQCDEADPKFIEGAKGGMLFNSVTSKLYDGKTGVLFIPSAYQRRFIHWGARGTPNSGFKGEFMPEVAVQMRDDGKVIELDGKLYFPLADGTINEKVCDRLVDTRNHFGILIDPESGNFSQVLISLASTNIKKSKQFMQCLAEVKVKSAKGTTTPPSFYNKARIVTTAESNDKGNWSGIKFTLEGFVEQQELYDAAKAFYKAVISGTAGAVVYQEPDEAAGETGSF